MLETFLIIYLIFVLFSLAIPVASYIFTGIGLSRMARACNLKSPWLAWVPIGDLYTIGAIAEIGAARSGKKSMPYRKIIPGIACGFLTIMVAFIALMVAFIISNPETFESDPSDESTDIGYVSYVSEDPSYDFGYGTDEEISPDEYGAYDEDADLAIVMFMLIMMLFYLVIFAAAIVLAIFEYLALWQVFKLFDESNAVLYLVLCIFVSFAMPIILFILGRKTPNLPTPEPVIVQPVTVGAMGTMGTVGIAPVAPVESVTPVQPATPAVPESTASEVVAPETTVEQPTENSNSDTQI